MTSPTPQSSSFLSNLVENLHQVKQSMMRTTAVRTNNVPGLTSAVRGQEAPGATNRTIGSVDMDRLSRQFPHPYRTLSGIEAATEFNRRVRDIGGKVDIGGGRQYTSNIKQASTALVRAMRRAGGLSAESINRAAQAMKPGTSRYVKHLGRGQFNVADLMVGNIAGKGRMAVRKIPSFDHARLKDAYTPLQADARKMNKMFPQSTGNPLFAEYLNIGRKGAFQRVANQATDLPAATYHYNQDIQRGIRPSDSNLLSRLKKLMWDVRPGNTGPEGQIFDYVSSISPGVGTVPYKTTRLFNVLDRFDDMKPTRFLREAKPTVAVPRKSLDVGYGPNHPKGWGTEAHWSDDYLAAAKKSTPGVNKANARLNNLIRKHWLGGGEKTGASMYKGAADKLTLDQARQNIAGAKTQEELLNVNKLKDPLRLQKSVADLALLTGYHGGRGLSEYIGYAQRGFRGLPKKPDIPPMKKGGADGRHGVSWSQYLSRMLADERYRIRENTGQYSQHPKTIPPLLKVLTSGPSYNQSLNAPARADMRAPLGVGSKYSPANPIQAHMGPAELKAHNLSNDNAPPMKKGGADEGSSGFLATLLRNLRDVSLVGAGGVSAGTAGNFLRRQLKHIKQYDPTIVSASPDRFAPKSVLRHILPKLREGDVLVHGDIPVDVKEVARQKHLLKLRKELNRQLRAAGGKPKSTPMSAIKLKAEKLVQGVRDMGSGGMGGFDEHAKIFTRPKIPGTQSYGPLISVTPTHIPDNPTGRRTPWVPAAAKARKNVATRKGRRQFFRDPVKSVKRIYDRYRLAQAQARKPVSQDQLNKLLRGTIEGSDELLDLASKDRPLPFSIMRPKKYSQRQAHQFMRQVANTTVDNPDNWQAALQRRLMPRWASDLIEKVRTKIRPGASQQGTNCAGGVCKAILGKGAYNLPSDFRQMKEFDTVVDVMPENVLKRMGGTPKNLDPVRKIMRRGAFRGSLPGMLGGLGLMGLGAYGAMKRASDRMDDGRPSMHEYLDWMSWRPEKTVKDRFGAPNQQPIINKIVRSKGRHGPSAQVPAASQMKAPRRRKPPITATRMKPMPMHPGIADFYQNTWHGRGQWKNPLEFAAPPKLDHLFKKDGTPIDAWSAQRKMIN